MDFNLIKEGKVVVQCDTRDEFVAFAKMCLDNGISAWNDGSRISLTDPLFDYYPQSNCYRVYIKQRLEYGKSEFFLKKKLDIVQFKELV